MFDRLRSVFAADPLKGARKEVGVSEMSSYLYSASDFDKYNPDDLLGVKGPRIYKKMKQDDQVKAVMKFKRDAVTSRDFYFDTSDLEDLTDDQIQLRVRLFNQVVKRLHGSWMDVLNNVMSASYNGVSFNELVFDKLELMGRTWWTVNRIRLRPFDTFHFQVDEHGKILGLYQKINGRRIDLDYRKFIHFVVNPDHDEHYGQSELREVYRDWFSKDNIIKFRNIWLERHAGGFRWIKPSGSKTVMPGSAEYNAIMDVLNNINTSTGVLLPSNLEMESDYPTNTTAFREAIEDCNMGIARAVLVPNLLGVSPQGKHGSLSQSDTQFEAFLWTLEADASRLEDTLNEQLFRVLGDVNFGDGLYPEFKLKPVSQSKQYDLLKTWADLIRGKAVQATDTDEAHIRDMLEFPEAGKPLPGPSAAPVAPSGKDPDPDEDEPDTDDDDEPDGETVDETIVGKGLVTASAFSRALKRVDFAVIGRAGDTINETHTPKISGVLGSMVQDLMVEVKDLPFFTDAAANVGDMSKLKFRSPGLTKLRGSVRQALRNGWDLGTTHAKNELDKARRSVKYSVDDNRLMFIEKKFFDLKSFAVAGNLSDSAIAVIKNVILNAAKAGRSAAQTELDIYKALVREGYLAAIDAPEAFYDALVSTLEVERGINVNMPHRVDTQVRTNTFEAINEARFGFFTDPSLGGYVEALEYSSILDARTTQICQHLDGQTHASDSEVWSSYRPPNHYNCRSLLVAVTEDDNWSESDEPNLEPQRGFS